MSLDDRVEAAPTRSECDPNSAPELLATLKVARLFIITAHDANAPYVKVILAKVDAAIAKADAEIGSRPHSLEVKPKP